MGVGQIAMAGYATLQTASGIKVHRQLQRQEKSIRGSRLLSDPTKQDLLHLKAGQKKWNAIGKIGGNAGLAAGQGMMFLGGTAVGLGTPLLIAGTVLTLGSILVKVAAQKKYDGKFAFDAAAIDQMKILGGGMLEDAVVRLEDERIKAKTNISWISLLSAAQQINARHPTASTEEKMARLHRIAQGMHRDSHEHSLHQRMTEMLDAPENRALFQACLSARAQGTASYAALLMSAPEQPFSMEETRARLAQFQAASPAVRITLMHALLKTAGIDSDVMQDLTRRLVVKEHGRGNRNGEKYKNFLDRETISRHRRVLWDKKKTVYAFRMEAFQAALRKGEESESGVLSHVEENFYRAVQKTISGAHAFKHRSRLLAANEMMTSVAGAEELRRLLASGNAPERRPVPVSDQSNPAGRLA
jgi:hypothetical protein